MVTCDLGWELGLMDLVPWDPDLEWDMEWEAMAKEAMAKEAMAKEDITPKEAMEAVLATVLVEKAAVLLVVQLGSVTIVIVQDIWQRTA